MVLMKAKEAAEALHLSLSTVGRLCHRGLLDERRVKDGGKLRFITPESVVRYQEAKLVNYRDLTLRLITLESTVAKLVRHFGLEDLPADTNELLRKHHPNLFRG